MNHPPSLFCQPIQPWNSMPHVPTNCWPFGFVDPGHNTQASELSHCAQLKDGRKSHVLVTVRSHKYGHYLQQRIRAFIHRYIQQCIHWQSTCLVMVTVHSFVHCYYICSTRTSTYLCFMGRSINVITIRGWPALTPPNWHWHKTPQLPW